MINTNSVMLSYHHLSLKQWQHHSLSLPEVLHLEALGVSENSRTSETYDSVIVFENN
jgi:hypothetical protein